MSKLVMPSLTTQNQPLASALTINQDSELEGSTNRDRDSQMSKPSTVTFTYHSKLKYKAWNLREFVHSNVKRHTRVFRQPLCNYKYSLTFKNSEVMVKYKEPAEQIVCFLAVCHWLNLWLQACGKWWGIVQVSDRWRSLRDQAEVQRMKLFPKSPLRCHKRETGHHLAMLCWTGQVLFADGHT